MLKSVLTFALTRRPIILLGLLVLIGGGILAYRQLNIEAYPNPAPVILEVTAQAAGQSAEEMERYYTIPLEVGLASTPGVDTIRSTSYYGLSFVRVTFKYGVDYYFAYTQAAISLQQRVSLPNNVQPSIQESSLVGEISRYQVVGPPNFGLTNLRTIQDWVLQRRLLTVPGVVQVNAWGGPTKEFEVEADLPKLEAYNITLPQLVAAIGNANINVGGRTINIGQQSVNIRGVGLIDSGGANDLTRGWKVDDIQNIVLTQSNGIPVLVKDVAKVYVGHVPSLGKCGRDKDEDVVTAIVVMNRTLRTKDVLARIEAEVAKINSDGTLPPGVRVVPFYDRGWLVSVTTNTVLHNLIFGCLLVFFIQWIFLGSLRGAVIVCANIPFALLFTVIVMVLRGEDANLLSIGAVDFGIVVDSAVILVENIFRSLQANKEERKKLLEGLSEGQFGIDPTKDYDMGTGRSWTDRLRLIYSSAKQVDRAIYFSTMITVAAFIPLFTMQGVEGQVFGPMAKTYGYALVGALIAIFTVSPVLASYLLPDKVKETETIVVRALRSAYTPALRWGLANRKIAVAAGLMFLAAVALLVPRLGTEFLPPLEEGNLDIHAAMPPTISLQAAMPTVAKIREILSNRPEVTTVVSQHGRPDNGSDSGGFSDAELFVFLKPFDQWPSGMTKEKLVEELQAEFDREFIGITFDFSQYIQTNVEEGLSGVKGTNSVKIMGPDLAVLEQIAARVLSEMDRIKGVEDLGIFRVLGQPNLNIKVDRAKAARYGLNAGDLNTVVQTALGGTVASTVLEADRQFNLTVRLAPEFRSNIDAVRNIKVGYQTGSANAYIPLSELADISLDTGASYIYHESNQRYIPIKFSVRGRDLGSTVTEAQRRIAQNVKLPSGYRIEWAGEFGELQEATKRLEFIVPVSLILIVAMLYGLFNSLFDSLLVLAGIPFAIAGGVLSLFISGLDFSISAAIGFVSLFGVSVMNNILLITHYNKLRLNGNHTDRDETMFHAAQERMRPMLMTALSPCIALLPAALSTGIGSQVQRPLAAVIVGGMLIGPVMLLLIVPPLRLFFVKKQSGELREQ